MKGVNKAIIVGNLGADPDVRYSAGGNAITKIRVATTESWKDKSSGERQEKTEWHRITFFGRLAEVAGEYLRKGASVYVEGRLQTSTYEKEGQTHYSTDIIASELQMLGGRAQSGQDRAQGGNANDGQTGGGQDDFDDSIPF